MFSSKKKSDQISLLKQGTQSSSSTTVDGTNLNPIYNSNENSIKKPKFSEDFIFYEEGDILLEQGNVTEKIIQILGVCDEQGIIVPGDSNDCILMTRIWSDGTREDIGFLSQNDYVGLLFYSGFKEMIFSSTVTYTCVKNNIKCRVIHCPTCESASEILCTNEICMADDTPENKLKKILYKQIFKVIPGFCALTTEELNDLLPYCKKISKDAYNTSSSNKQQFVTTVGDSEDKSCFILLDGKLRITTKTNDINTNLMIVRDKEPLELFGEIFFRNENAKRTASIYAVEQSSYLKIDIVKLKTDKTDIFNKIKTKIRQRGNLLDFTLQTKNNHLNFSVLSDIINVNDLVVYTPDNDVMKIAKVTGINTVDGTFDIQLKSNEVIFKVPQDKIRKLH